MTPAVRGARGQRVTIRLGTGEDLIETTDHHAVVSKQEFDPVYATRVIADIIPNAWVGYSVVERFMSELHRQGWTDDQVDSRSGYLLEELRRFLSEQRDSLAEARFKREVTAGRIQFRLRSDANNWHMPTEIETSLDENAQQLVRPDGTASEKSVFSPQYRADFNDAEAEFACYLDGDSALVWWHRNVAKTGYGLQGWRQHRIYPDFLFALTGKGKRRILYALETKGDQLAGNLDTTYKRRVLDFVTNAFTHGVGVQAGQMELVGSDADVRCKLVLLSDAKAWLASEVRSVS